MIVGVIKPSHNRSSRDWPHVCLRSKHHHRWKFTPKPSATRATSYSSLRERYPRVYNPLGDVYKAQIPSSQFLDRWCAAHDFETSDVVVYQRLERKPIEVTETGWKARPARRSSVPPPWPLTHHREQERLYLKVEEDKLVKDLDSPSKLN